MDLKMFLLDRPRQYKSAVFLQQPSGKFVKTIQPALDKDSTYEDVDACWADVNNDGNIDLVVASGGNEFYGSMDVIAIATEFI